MPTSLCSLEVLKLILFSAAGRKGGVGALRDRVQCVMRSDAGFTSSRVRTSFHELTIKAPIIRPILKGCFVFVDSNSLCPSAPSYLGEEKYSLYSIDNRVWGLYDPFSGNLGPEARNPKPIETCTGPLQQD